MLNFSSTNLNIIWADPITFWPHSVIKILSVLNSNLKFDLMSTSHPLHTSHWYKSGLEVLEQDEALAWSWTPSPPLF